MRRLGIWIAVGALIFGLAPRAMAQLDMNSYTINWRGEMRVHGIVWDNVSDFDDDFDDDQSRYYERFRLWTTIESKDKKARAVWALEVGDLTWGRGGGPSAFAFGGGGTRVGPGQGAEVGNDGVNVETKQLYIQFEVPGLAGTDLLLGGHNWHFMDGSNGALVDDDGMGIQLNWKRDPVDFQFFTIKASENDVNDSDDNDVYAFRFGAQATPDVRLTLEAMLIDYNCLRRADVQGATVDFDVAVVDGVVTAIPVVEVDSRCVSADFGDSFWIGGTATAKVALVKIDGGIVYGEKAVWNGDTSNLSANNKEKGFLLYATGQVPIGPVNTWWHGWYTSGDENVGPNGSIIGESPGDVDRFPTPIPGSSYFSVPFVAEWLFGTRTIGLPAVGQPLYGDLAGTYGIGASAIGKVTPAVSLGGGVGYVGASDAPGVFGDNVFEIDGGVLYTYNELLSFQGIASYLIPDTGDDGWALGWRTRFSF